MDKKPYAPRYPSTAKNYNANYVSDLKLNIDSIDTTYTIFSSGEYEDIIKVIQGNEILNFRNTQGETLIHAILKNPSSSLKESDILEIIRDLVHKNVSVNAMNEYNQTPLHLASSKGYYDIIEYLISLKTDVNKVDNYGNAPIHYIIDKFVTECKEGEYFKESNKKLNKSQKKDSSDSKVDKYTKMTENLMILELIDNIKTGDCNDLLQKIKQIIEHYKYYKIIDIQKIKETKILDIENIFKKHSSVSVESQIKDVFNGLIKEINDDIYKDFKIENKQNKSGDNEFINSDTLKNIDKIIVDEKNKCNSTYSKKIEEIISTIDKLKPVFDKLDITLITLLRILIFSFYVKKIFENKQNTDGTYFNETISILDKIINIFYDDNEQIFMDFDEEIKINSFINEDGVMYRTKFIRTLNIESAGTIFPLQLTIDRNNILDIGHYPPISTPPPKFHSLPPTQLPYKKIEIANITPPGKYCKLVPIFNIFEYISDYFEILDYLKHVMLTKIETYQYFYFNYITEILVNIANNLTILKKCYEKININKILFNLIDFEKKLDAINIQPTVVPFSVPSTELHEDENKIINMLIRQLDFIPTEKYDLYKNPQKDHKIIQLIEHMQEQKFQDVVKKLNQSLNQKIIIQEFDKIYSSISTIYKINNDIISTINTNFSLKYLENYKKHIETDVDITVNNFANNRFYPIISKFPDNLTTYSQKYYINDKLDVVMTKKDLLKKYYDYDFNNLYTGELKFQIVKRKLIGTPATSDSLDPPYTLDYIIPPMEYKVLTSNINYNCGYNKQILNTIDILKKADKDGIFINKSPYKDLIKNDGTNMQWLKEKDKYKIIKTENIPLISFEHIKQIIQMIAHKILIFIDDTKLDNIIINVQNEIIKQNIPKKKLQNIKETLDYLQKNKPLLKKVITDKFIIFLISYVKTLINNEINELIQTVFIDDMLNNITNKPSIATSYKGLPKEVVLDISKFYKTQLTKYTINKMIPEILLTSTTTPFKDIEEVVIELNVGDYIKSGEKKLLLNKCIVNNRIDILKDTLLNKINLRTLDRNGNTILNRLIDQYNDYAIQKVLELDNELYTYKNNRDQNSIEYLFDVMESINSNYSWNSINKRLKSYESDLQVWIKSESSFGEIELDESKHMIYNIILNSLYLFNEYLWLHLLKAPNGWKFEDKKKLKEIIKKYLDYNINEKLLIKTLEDTDKETMKNKTELIVFNNKIDIVIKELQNEIIELENTKKQLEEEEKTNELGKNGIDILIVDNTTKINDKQKDIDNLNKVKISGIPVDKLDKIFENIKNTDLINELDINWNNYNKLIINKDDFGNLPDNIIWNYYLPIINIMNNKNTDTGNKYISYYNYSLLNLDYKNNKLDDSEIQVLINYYTKIINNVYSDFYDLEKYEDSEFNYINDAILNIIYLNLVNVIKIEMFSAIIGYITNTYTDNEIIKNYKDSKITVLLDIIDKLLKTIIWDKLDMKNKDFPQNYVDYTVHENELKIDIKTIFKLLDSDEDNQNLDNIIKFYKGLVENVSFNIYNEIKNFLNDMKKVSLLFGILNIINTHKNK